MSASLVGSEMCIRDSARPAERKVCAAAARASACAAAVAARTSGAGGRAGQSRGCAAVSYTHLTLPTICSV
eukprot:13931255-Alexandrium_andersonii.AAC.1